jgi:formylglycine-generating enzyme required for sulfatase activity
MPMIKGRILKLFALLTIFFFINAVGAGNIAPQKDEDILLKARTLIREGDFEGAIKELYDVIAKLKTILAQKRNLAEAYYLLARVYKIVQMEDKYKEHLKMAFKTFPNLNLPEPDPEIRDMVDKVKAELEAEKIIPKEKPIQPKKKKFPVLLTLAGAALVTAVVLVLTRKKNPDESRYDTEVLGIQWIDIPAGEFLMGDNFNEGEADEQPVHWVNLSAYKISRYEVTFAQYDTFCTETSRNKPNDYGWGRDTRPVVDVSWDDAKAFCDWLSQKTGKNLHLPSEAQWEKAARGTSQGKYPWGNTSPSCDTTNYNSCEGGPLPVGSRPADVSPYGVYDMAGNVGEWCGDRYDAAYYAVSPRDNPTGPGSGTRRVIRGGGWMSTADKIRCSHRDGTSPSGANNRIGFRICQD